MPVLSNARHERFAQAIAQGSNGTEAYLSAGYDSNPNSAAVSANHLLKNDKVTTRIDELLQERASIHAAGVAEAISKVALTKEWVLERLMENVARAMQAQAVKDGEGEAIGEFSYNGGVANRALELLGKELGMFIERKEVGGPGDFDAMSSDEIEAEIHHENAVILAMLPAGNIRPA